MLDGGMVGVRITAKVHLVTDIGLPDFHFFVLVTLSCATCGNYCSSQIELLSSP